MELPAWVSEVVKRFEAPETGKVEIALEIYQNGVSKMEIGGTVRVKPSQVQADK